MLALITTMAAMTATATMTSTATRTILGIGNRVMVNCAGNPDICNACKSSRSVGLQLYAR